MWIVQALNSFDQGCYIESTGLVRFVQQVHF